MALCSSLCFAPCLVSKWLVGVLLLLQLSLCLKALFSVFLAFGLCCVVTVYLFLPSTSTTVCIVPSIPMIQVEVVV